MCRCRPAGDVELKNVIVYELMFKEKKHGHIDHAFSLFVKI